VRSWIRQWPMWSLPRTVIIVVLVVELVAVALTAATAAQFPIRSSDLITAGILAVGSMVHLESVRRIERVREGLRANAPYVDLKSVWTFAATLILPPVLAVALVVLTYTHLLLRVIRIPPFRAVYSCATVVLATYAAAAVLHAGLPPGAYPGLPALGTGVAVIMLAGLMRWFVNHGLVVTVILLHSPHTPGRTALGSFSNNVVEVAAVALGGVTALAAVYQPWYIALIMPVLLVLHRALLLHQYEVAARTDTKTGLVNAVYWADTARRELLRAEQDHGSVGIVMLDLDRFKSVNDEYGHLAGDIVLKTVGETLREHVRERDLVGRFGGEEFVILLPGANVSSTVTTAERIRISIATLGVEVPTDEGSAVIGVSASVGVAVYPQAGKTLDDVMHAADSALYRAKQTGRNKVVSTLDMA
jgi:diguanylate cyclase (GGDEF)-like protein